MRNHYERLGVQPDDDRETIWRAYLSAVRSALSAKEPTAALRAIDQAWEVLRDPASRAAYDRALANSAGPREPASSGALPATPLTRRVAASTAQRAPAGPPPPGPEVAPTGAQRLPVAASPDAEARATTPEADTASAPAAGATTPPEADTASAPAAGATTPPEAAEEPAAPPGERAPRRQRKRVGRRRRWDAPAHVPRRRIAAVLAWLLACAVGGAAAGLGVHMLRDQPVEFSEGDCVTLTEAEAFPAPCGSLAADGEVTAVVGEPGGCEGASGGWVERADGRFACVELLGPD